MEPFRDLNELGRGDQIEVEMPYDTFLYRMQRTQVVESNAFWVKGVLSIEHEDALASRDEGLEHALALLRRVTARAARRDVVELMAIEHVLSPEAVDRHAPRRRSHGRRSAAPSS